MKIACDALGAAAGLMMVTIGAVHLSRETKNETATVQRELQTACPELEKPLQVFLMMGQSNMVGKGSMDHLDHLMNDEVTRPKYEHLYDESTQDWAESENVHVSFNRRGDELFGKLKAGEFGDDSGIPKFGPDIEFGFTLERAQCGCDSPILIIKCASGGNSLVKEWRPPSSSGETGQKYESTMFEIREVLESLEEGLLIPDYIPAFGYEIKGMVWFQGYNDIFEPDWYNEYKQNLINLISDVRHDLEVPDLPVVVGELGMHGFESQATDLVGALAVREAQQEAVGYFDDSVVYVPTAQFINTDDETYEYEYHYYGRADIVFDIGEAFGNAMVDLIGGSTTCGAE